MMSRSTLGTTSLQRLKIPLRAVYTSIRNESSESFEKINRDGRVQRPIFVAATKQHIGKTSVSMALLSGLQKRFDKVGFMYVRK